MRLIINDLETVWELPKPADITLEFSHDNYYIDGENVHYCLYFALKNLVKEHNKTEIWVADNDDSSEVYVWWSDPNIGFQQDNSHVFKTLCEQQDDFKGWVKEPHLDGDKLSCAFKNGYCTTKVEVENGIMTLNDGEMTNKVGTDVEHWVEDLFVS